MTWNGNVDNNLVDNNDVADDEDDAADVGLYTRLKNAC